MAETIVFTAQNTRLARGLKNCRLEAHWRSTQGRESQTHRGRRGARLGGGVPTMTMCSHITFDISTISPNEKLELQFFSQLHSVKFVSNLN